MEQETAQAEELYYSVNLFYSKTSQKRKWDSLLIFLDSICKSQTEEKRFDNGWKHEHNERWWFGTTFFLAYALQVAAMLA